MKKQRRQRRPAKKSKKSKKMLIVGLLCIPLMAWLLWPQQSRSLTNGELAANDDIVTAKKSDGESVRLRRPRIVRPDLNDAELQEELLAEDQQRIQDHLSVLVERRRKSLPKFQVSLFDRRKDLLRAARSTRDDGSPQNIANAARRELLILQREAH